MLHKAQEVVNALRHIHRHLTIDHSAYILPNTVEQWKSIALHSISYVPSIVKLTLQVHKLCLN